MKLRTIAAAVLLAGAAAAASAASTLDQVRARGEVVCGVNTSEPGFSGLDSKGNWSGIDVDVCRAVAAAVLGDAKKVKYVALTSPQRFTALQSGEVDLLSRNTTWTLSRDGSQGLLATTINYYDGQGFMVPKKYNIHSAKQLNGATICIQSGTDSIQNLAAWAQANGIKYKTVMFDTTEAVQGAFLSGRCQAYSTDIADLAGVYTRTTNPADFEVLPEVISKEPLAPWVRRGDDAWFNVVRWTVFALINAEELGITKDNATELAKTSTNPDVRRFLGVTDEDTGKDLGLPKTWARQIVEQVGNYGESWAANLGPKTPLNLPRAHNNLWTKGGLLYAPPIR